METLKEGLQEKSDGANLALQQSAEDKCLRLCANQGWGLDPKHFASSTGAADRKIGGGNEHDVFLHEDSQRVVKITKIGPSRNYGAQGTPVAYLTNLELQNSIFGDDLRFEGLLPCDSGYSIVTPQPSIEGEPAPLEDIDHFFGSFGSTALENFSSQNKAEQRNLNGVRLPSTQCVPSFGEWGPIPHRYSNQNFPLKFINFTRTQNLDTAFWTDEVLGNRWQKRPRDLNPAFT